MELHEVLNTEVQRTHQTEIAVKNLEMRGIFDPRVKQPINYVNLFDKSREYDEILNAELILVRGKR